MKTVLITGVAGLLGSNLALWLHRNRPEVNVVGIDNLSGGYPENIPRSVKFYGVDLLEADTVRSIFEQHKPDYVFHFAAYAAECLSPFIRRFNFTNNLTVTAGIVNECIRHNVKRLVFTSSMSVYGRGIPPFDETQPRQPIDSYGIAKSACEQDIEVAGEQHGLDYCIIRPHNFYGARQNIWDSYRNVLGIWMYKLINNQPLTIFGDGEQIRAFSYVDDSLPCFWRAAISPACSKQIINLGGTKECSINIAADTLIQISGRKAVKEYLPARHEVKHATASWQKSMDLLGYEHVTSLADGLTKMWQWAQTQPNRPRQIWTEYELDKGVYPYWKQDTLVTQAAQAKML